MASYQNLNLFPKDSSVFVFPVSKSTALPNLIANVTRCALFYSLTFHCTPVEKRQEGTGGIVPCLKVKLLAPQFCAIF